MAQWILDCKIPITIENLAPLLLDESHEIKFADLSALNRCRTYLDEHTDLQTQPVYGINTGFGSLCNVRIPDSDLELLQYNLIRSHACGMGATLSNEVVRLMLYLKIRSLSYGYSGVQEATVKLLAEFLNHGIYPIVYEKGSLGASGDLAPLAHLCLPLIGEGRVRFKGHEMPASDALKACGLAPLRLKSKEGLALLNGTQFMSALAVYGCLKAKRLLHSATLCSALSADVFLAHRSPFDADLHQIRPHPGAIAVSRNLRGLLQKSKLQELPRPQVQDPYSFRCIPQVHGASDDALGHVTEIVEREINAVTDNPVVFSELDKIISGGHFHGQSLALGMDYLAIALAELANISERRVYLLISGQRELPPYLCAEAGLNSGFMITQYTAASIVSQNKQLCTPASVDSIVSSNGQEDHVSMGANAATKLIRVLENVQSVLGIEWLCACQALDFRRPVKSASQLEDLHEKFRKQVPFIKNDQILSEYMIKAAEFIFSQGDV
jgi:histidine ammonia-lyase